MTPTKPHPTVERLLEVFSYDGKHVREMLATAYAEGAYDIVKGE